MKPDPQAEGLAEDKKALTTGLPTAYPYPEDFDGEQDRDGYEPEVGK